MYGPRLHAQTNKQQRKVVTVTKKVDFCTSYFGIYCKGNAMALSCKCIFHCIAQLSELQGIY